MLIISNANANRANRGGERGGKLTYRWIDNRVVERMLADFHLANSGGLDPDVVANAPLLENYSVAIGPAYALSRVVSGHPHLKDGREIVTSQLFYLDPERAVARTLNRWYRLGLPHGFQRN
ncbi:DUF6634 family protein [Rhizobium mongolense]|uniref:DUF6634 family protein n=1 Tax=Rhizobium mongolense TaxID=57676 RepID=UPI0035580AD2